MRVRTSEGREGRFIVWRGRKWRGEERDITAIERKAEMREREQKHIARPIRGWYMKALCQSKSGTTRRHGSLLGKRQKKELNKNNNNGSRFPLLSLARCGCKMHFSSTDDDLRDAMAWHTPCRGVARLPRFKIVKTNTASPRLISLTPRLGISQGIPHSLSSTPPLIR